MQPEKPTPRQLIKCVWGLRFGSEREFTLIQDDSTLMAMDAPEVLPAGSCRRDEPLQDHADPRMRGYFTVRETVVFREPLADGSHRA